VFANRPKAQIGPRCDTWVAIGRQLTAFVIASDPEHCRAKHRGIVDSFGWDEGAL
jgi:hypothetical protein